jgi:hypothetical protein
MSVDRAQHVNEDSLPPFVLCVVCKNYDCVNTAVAVLHFLKVRISFIMRSNSTTCIICTRLSGKFLLVTSISVPRYQNFQRSATWALCGRHFRSSVNTSLTQSSAKVTWNLMFVYSVKWLLRHPVRVTCWVVRPIKFHIVVGYVMTPCILVGVPQRVTWTYSAMLDPSPFKDKWQTALFKDPARTAQ